MLLKGVSNGGISSFSSGSGLGIVALTNSSAPVLLEGGVLASCCRNSQTVLPWIKIFKCSSAAGRGYLGVQQWLRFNGFLWDDSARQDAVAPGEGISVFFSGQGRMTVSEVNSHALRRQKGAESGPSRLSPAVAVGLLSLRV